jgi:regulator of protease activity HflC (stomatin/prohibitin superfamily)
MIFLIMVAPVIVIVMVLVLFVAGLRIADQYQRAVVLRLGRFQAIRGPGLYWIIPVLEWQLTVDIRTVTATVEQQETITKDNVPVKINAVVWYRIFDPKKAMLEVRSVDNAVIQVALTTLRTGIGRTRSTMYSRSRRPSRRRLDKRSMALPSLGASRSSVSR